MKIEFIPVSKDAELLVPSPKPAKLFIPEWYKKMENPNEPIFSKTGDILNQNVKKCVPFLDALTHGYIQETWTDIYIQFDGKGLGYYQQTKPEIIKHRDKPGVKLLENLFYDMEFIWKEQWIPKLPKGYSAIYTSPFNHTTLPFRCLDAIIDSDMYYHEYAGQYPFYIYNGFSGLIPAGTPMYQIIPVKREKWVSQIHKFNEEQNKIRNNQIRKYFFWSYKKQFWQKKTFN